VRYSVTEPIRNRCFCHCESCRRAAGAPFVAWGTVSDADFSLGGGELALHRSSAGVERGFCAACGTTLTYRHAGRAGEVDFTLASLDQPERVEPVMHIWVQDKLPWVRIDDGLLKYQTVPGAAVNRT
jgi:hypothetical protein